MFGINLIPVKMDELLLFRHKITRKIVLDLRIYSFGGCEISKKIYSNCQEGKEISTGMVLLLKMWLIESSNYR